MTRKGFPDEYPITLVLNGHELATYQLTKSDLEDWAVGYIYTEGIIEGLADVRKIVVDDDHGKVLVELHDELEAESFIQRPKHFTAGCGNGVTFFSMTDVKKFPKITSTRTETLSYLLKKVHEFGKKTPLYLETGGMHGACIIEQDGKMTVREDIGRHNAVDKVIGYAVREGLDPKTLILLTSGRISYEMISKTARFGIGLIGSRTTPTKQAIQLANFLKIEVVAYMRGRMATVCTSQKRVINDISKESEK